MRKLYQVEWHDINFEEVSEMSPKHFPGNDFYQNFYSVFNQRYKNISDLSPDWLKLKLNAAEIVNRELAKTGSSSVLSLGVGLGVIEGALLDAQRYKIFIQEVAPEALRFIKLRVPADKTFIGAFPECIPNGVVFDAIILGGIEYLYNNDELSQLVEDARALLKPNGSLILISWSYYEINLYNIFKYYLKEALISMGFYNKKLQLWGYERTQNELKLLVESVGFAEEDVLIDRRMNKWETLIGRFSKNEKISEF